MLEVQSLNVSYGKLQVLWNVSFKITKGEVVAILGLNGAGKTTMLKTIAGLIAPMSGKVLVDNVDTTGLRTDEIVRQGLCFVPEERNLFSAMSVLDNLLMGAYTIKDKKQIKETLEYIYTLFPILAERSKQYVGTMSGGERQMVAIARGLMNKPKIVMLDEPSMGLSPKNVLVVFDTIKTLANEGVTVVIVEQNVKTTLQVTSRAYIMEHGQIAKEGLSVELRADKNVQRMYLGID